MASLLPPHDGLLPKWLLLVCNTSSYDQSALLHFSLKLTLRNSIQVAITSIGNSIQAYSTLSYTQRLYSGSGPASKQGDNASGSAAATSPVTPLSARTFGTWTFMAGIVRLYAAYHINEAAWYQVAFWTYLIAFGHFMSEMAVYQTAKWRGPWLASATVATSSLIWMALQYGYYVQ